MLFSGITRKYSQLRERRLYFFSDFTCGHLEPERVISNSRKGKGSSTSGQQSCDSSGPWENLKRRKKSARLPSEEISLIRTRWYSRANFRPFPETRLARRLPGHCDDQPSWRGRQRRPWRVSWCCCLWRSRPVSHPGSSPPLKRLSAEFWRLWNCTEDTWRWSRSRDAPTVCSDWHAGSSTSFIMRSEKISKKVFELLAHYELKHFVIRR